MGGGLCSFKQRGPDRKHLHAHINSTFSAQSALQLSKLEKCIVTMRAAAPAGTMVITAVLTNITFAGIFKKQCKKGILPQCRTRENHALL
eukprot:1136917-Pelagomonas_calceolata.AAC.3